MKNCKHAYEIILDWQTSGPRSRLADQTIYTSFSHSERSQTCTSKTECMLLNYCKFSGLFLRNKKSNNQILKIIIFESITYPCLNLYHLVNCSYYCNISVYSIAIAKDNLDILLVRILYFRCHASKFWISVLYLTFCIDVWNNLWNKWNPNKYTF